MYGKLRSVKCHSYRTARPLNAIGDFPRDMMADTERELAEKAGVYPDNHTVYEIVDYMDRTFYLWFHDSICRIATHIEVGRF